MKKVFSLAVLMLLVLQLLPSCGNTVDEAEIKEAAAALIEASYEINEIYFGDGLPYREEEVKYAEEQLGDENDVENAVYLNVKEDCGFKSVSEIKAATSAVYSKTYCEQLFKVGFEGLQDSEGQLYRYARYVENEYFDLTVRYGLEKESRTQGRTYDIDSISVETVGRNFAILRVDSLIGSSPSAAVTLKIVKEENGWRLDTPTY